MRSLKHTVVGQKKKELQTHNDLNHMKSSTMMRSGQTTESTLTFTKKVDLVELKSN